MLRIFWDQGWDSRTGWERGEDQGSLAFVKTFGEGIENDGLMRSEGIKRDDRDGMQKGIRRYALYTKCVTAFTLLCLRVVCCLNHVLPNFGDFPGTGVVISHLKANLDWVGDLRSNVYNL
jgi:hypothetical protein